MINKKQIRKAILQNLNDNSRWNMVVPPNNWLCPYCGEIGVENLTMKDKIEKKIFSHLMEGCTSWHFFEGEELDEEILAGRALLLQLKAEIPQAMEQDPSWGFHDKQGCWFCPYCLESTGLPMEEIQGSPDGFFTHLSQCSPFLEREGEAHEVAEVKRGLAHHHKNIQLHFLKEKILSKPEWQALDSHSHWLCPYCLTQTDMVLSRGKVAKAALEGILKHLAGCAKYQRGKGKISPMVQIKKALADSNTKNQFQKLFNSISSDSLWQLLTDEGHWFCPYCADSSDVAVPDYNWTKALPKISQHLGNCQDRKFSKDPRPFEEVKAKLEYYNKKQKILATLKGEFANPLFRCTVKGGGWVCPYCQKPQPHIILIGGDPTMSLNDIGDHLSVSCQSYQLGSLPKITLKDLQKAFKKKSPGRAPSVILRKQKQSARIQKVRDEQKKLLQSLEDAREKQLKMLPQVPEIQGLEFQCLYRPCSHIGGDFYDIVSLPDNKLSLTIGDVAGHGIEAALLVGMVKKLLEIHGKTSSSPMEVLSRTHQDLLGDLDDRTFISVFYGILDLETRVLRIANGGHLPLLLYNKKREVPLQAIHLEGMALGLGSGEVFHQTLQEVDLELMAGDVLFLYTDGIIEARRGEDDFFGEEKLLEIVKKYGKYELEYLLYKVEKAVNQFQGSNQEDDMTILSLMLK